MKFTAIIFGLLVVLITSACHSKDEEFAKPLGQVRLDYPNPTYRDFISDCPFTFSYSNFAREYKKKDHDCWYVINYPKMKANIYLTYYPINNQNDLALKIKDSEKFVQDQTVKASYISPQDFVFPDKKVYGTLFELGGESAINLQFHITDSTKNLISGSVYFSSPPKPDSLAPAIVYIKKDVKKLIETVRWKQK